VLLDLMIYSGSFLMLATCGSAADALEGCVVSSFSVEVSGMSKS